MGNFFLFLIFYKYLIDKVLYLNKRSLSQKTGLNSVSKSIVSIINVVAEKLFKEQYSLITNDLLRFTQ